jgi:hypothetical protein
MAKEKRRDKYIEKYKYVKHQAYKKCSYVQGN